MERYDDLENKKDENTVESSEVLENLFNEIVYEDENNEKIEDAENSEVEENDDASCDDENKKYQIVTGNGSEIEISPVREYLNTMKPKTHEEKSKRNIVIPEVKKADNKENDSNE